MRMARSIGFGLLGSLSWLAVAGPAPAEAARPCTLRTLHGSYLFRDLWVNWQSSGAGQQTSSAVATLTFDGDGNLSGTVTIRQVGPDGTLTVTGPLTTTGTYVMNSDCTATITVAGLEGGLEVVVLLRGDVFLQTAPVGGFFSNENMIGIGVRH